jgi:hypothetical protein
MCGLGGYACRMIADRHRQGTPMNGKELPALPLDPREGIDGRSVEPCGVAYDAYHQLRLEHRLFAAPQPHRQGQQRRCRGQEPTTSPKPVGPDVPSSARLVLRRQVHMRSRKFRPTPPKPKSASCPPSCAIRPEGAISRGPTDVAFPPTASRRDVGGLIGSRADSSAEP